MKWSGFLFRYRSGKFNFSLVSENGKVIEWKRHIRFPSVEEAKLAAECSVDFGDTIEWKEGQKK